MNKREQRQHAHDTRIAENAVRDAAPKQFAPRGGSRTQLLFCQPRLFQPVGSISMAGLQVAICIMAVALSSLTVRADGPWFSGYIDQTNSYRRYTFCDWDTALYGVGIDPDSDFLGIQPPSYRVDGHVVYEADGTGNCVVIESTGSLSTTPIYLVGSVHPVSVQYEYWYSNPSSAPASDTRHDMDINFLNILSDPVSASTNLVVSIWPAVEVCWPSQTNHSYQVQYRSALDTNTWFDFAAPVPGDGGTNCVFDSTRGRSNRFYRVVELP